MSNASLQEQLQAVVSQIAEPANNRKGSNKPDKIYSVNKTKKTRWLEYVQYGIELLKVYFPQTFKESKEVQPLKKGIKQDLVKRLSEISNIVTEDKACMVKSLSYYVNTFAYHKSVVLGAARIDLDGHPNGEVTAEEAKHALEKQASKLQFKKTNMKNKEKSQ